MNRSLYIASIFCLITANTLIAQEQQESERMMAEFRRRAVIININARVLDRETSPASGEETHEQVVIWTETHEKITMPGSPVGIRMVGANVVVSVQFTPFIRRHGNVLVAQGQIWYSDPHNGVSYYTSIQTIPIEFDEPIYFFPLGQSRGINPSSSIEVILTINPYREKRIPPTINTNNENE